MARLIVMRHAKSSWASPETPDRERPLNARGRLAAVLMGAWLEEAGLVPDHALVSPARRARETWARLRRGFAPADPPATEIPELYMADAQAVLDALRAAPAAAETVLMIGHEPGLSDFLRRVQDGRPAKGAGRAQDRFPTAAAAVLDCPDAPWAEIAFGRARLSRFAVPRDLV